MLFKRSANSSVCLLVVKSFSLFVGKGFAICVALIVIDLHKSLRDFPVLVYKGIRSLLLHLAFETRPLLLPMSAGPSMFV